MSEKSVILIVPGACHTPHHYAHLALRLNTSGYTVDCVELETSSPDKYTEDVSIIRNAIESHVDADRDVVVVMHSYGGLPGTEACVGLGKTEGRTAGVVKLVYMTAYMFLEGGRLADLDHSVYPICMKPDDEVCFSFLSLSFPPSFLLIHFYSSKNCKHTLRALPAIPHLNINDVTSWEKKKEMQQHKSNLPSTY